MNNSKPVFAVLAVSVSILTGFLVELPWWTLIVNMAVSCWGTWTIMNWISIRRKPYSQDQWKRLIDIGDQALGDQAISDQARHYDQPGSTGQRVTVIADRRPFHDRYVFLHTTFEQSPDDPTVGSVIHTTFIVDRSIPLVHRLIDGVPIWDGDFQELEPAPRRNLTHKEVTPDGHELDELANWFATAEPALIR